MQTPFGLDLEAVLKLIFYLVALCYVIFSVIFHYHWMQYAVDKRVRFLSLLTYFATTLPLIGIMALFAFM